MTTIPESTLVGWVKTGPEGIKLSGGQFEGMNARNAGRPRPENTVAAD
jgi:hypothetical protein